MVEMVMVKIRSMVRLLQQSEEFSQAAQLLTRSLYTPALLAQTFSIIKIRKTNWCNVGKNVKLLY